MGQSASARRRPAGGNLGDGATAEFRALEQVEGSVEDFDVSARTPNEPTAHDVRMERAHEHPHPPEWNAATDQALTQLGEHLVRLHRRARAIDEPIDDRPDVVGCHPTAAL